MRAIESSRELADAGGVRAEAVSSGGHGTLATEPVVAGGTIVGLLGDHDLLRVRSIELRGVHGVSTKKPPRK